MQHEEVCKKLNKIYHQKNEAYGNSVTTTFNLFGLIAYIVRINDKINRINTLVKNTNINHNDESIKDTLYDLANYCILAICDIESKEENNEKT